jgi:hypothetical protein
MCASQLNPLFDGLGAVAWDGTLRAATGGVVVGFAVTDRTGAAMHLTGTAWTVMLHLAEDCGWQPEGTIAPPGVEPGNWAGDYDSNEGQSMSAADAAAFASALERASLDHNRSRTIQQVADRISAMVREANSSDYQIETGASYWSAIDELIRLCRRGPVVLE